MTFFMLIPGRLRLIEALGPVVLWFMLDPLGAICTYAFVIGL